METAPATLEDLLEEIIAHRFPTLPRAERRQVVAATLAAGRQVAGDVGAAALTHAAVMRAGRRAGALPVRTSGPLQWTADGVDARLELAPIAAAGTPVAEAVMPAARGRLERCITTGVTLVGAVLIAVELLTVVAGGDAPATSSQRRAQVAPTAAPPAPTARPIPDVSAARLRRVRAALRRPLPQAAAPAVTVVPAAVATPVAQAMPDAPVATVAPAAPAPAVTAPPAPAPTTAPASPQPAQSFDDAG